MTPDETLRGLPLQPEPYGEASPLAGLFTDEALTKAFDFIATVRTHGACAGSVFCAEVSIDRLIDARRATTSFLSNNGVYGTKTLNLDRQLPILWSLLAMASPLSRSAARKISEWFWCAALTGWPDEASVSDPAPALYVLGLAPEPDFMSNFRFAKAHVTREQGLRLTNLRKAAIGVLVATGVADPIDGRSLLDRTEDSGRWSTVPIFEDSAFETGSAFSATDPVNFLPVSVATKKLLGTSVQSFLLSADYDDLFGDRLDTFFDEAGVEPACIRSGNVDRALLMREDWCAERVSILLGREIQDTPVAVSELTLPDVWMSSRGAVGYGVRGANGTITILPGSTMSADFNPTLRPIALQQRSDMIAKEQVELREDGFWTVIRPVEFVSYSAAASALSGRNSARYKWVEFEEGETRAKIAELEPFKGNLKKRRAKNHKVASTSSEEPWPDEVEDIASLLFDFDDDEMDGTLDVIEDFASDMFDI